MVNLKSSQSIQHQSTYKLNKLNFRIPVFTNNEFVGVSVGTPQKYLTILFCILTIGFKRQLAAPPLIRYTILDMRIEQIVIHHI